MDLTNIAYGSTHWPTPEKAYEGILAHFIREFPADPYGEAARHFSKRNCKECHGRGMQVRHVAGEEKPQVGFCICVRRRISREADALWKTHRPYFGPVGPGPVAAPTPAPSGEVQPSAPEVRDE
jgi:hypothetical protein